MHKDKSILPKPDPVGSYSSQDVTFLLKDISNLMEEQGNEEREKAIQSGLHYSEMLPIEYRPTKEYIRLFHESLSKFARKIAIAVGTVSEVILKRKGKNVVLVSLARAGTPAGILIRRYIKHRYDIDLPHYSISIIRGKGIDENAMRYILACHPESNVQFVDGWTGKGAISNELSKACSDYKEKYKVSLNSDLAVIADPGYCTSIYGTREDFLIPSACLNATVSGLVSRTVHKKAIIDENDFHGVKFYRELLDEDVSNLFVDTVSNEYPSIEKQVQNSLIEISSKPIQVPWLGMKDVEKIREYFDISSVHFIKPGIGETTRVLLRRVPWKVLVRKDAKNIEHILQLASERNVPVEIYNLSAYQCCGIIKSMEEKKL